MSEYIRLDKFFSSQGVCSRKELKDLIKKGLVTVNGSAKVKSDMKIDPQNDAVTYSGREIKYKEYIYIMLNKPKGVVSATEDKNEKTVLDLLPDEFIRKGLFPVGRLDKDTTGLLIITDDGELAHKALSPKNHVEKTYIAKLIKEISDEDIKLIEKGIELADGYKCMPAKLKRLEDNEDYDISITICEGKYHQVKRMFAAVGNRVEALRRISMGELKLDENLAEGECKEIMHKEVENFLFIKRQ